MADPSETTQVSREPAEHETEELLGAVRTLAAQVGGLQEDVLALRQEARGLPTADGERPGWEEGAQQAVVRESPAWVRSVDSPGTRGIEVPWLLLEIVFLVAVAVLAAVAGLDAPVIAAVMVVAWLLVAIAEWAGARNAVRGHALVYGASAPPLPGVPDDPLWFDSGADEAAPDVAADDRPATRLPPPQPE
jgi:hypothetical protein